MQNLDVTSTEPSKGREVSLFLFLAAVLIPVLTIALVGAYGFSIWMYQIFIAGPPTN
ncbi:periplasmic nitrate reductase, NapE protein [Kiloniella laminariae]|uniref:Periplasmic nitrate reductase, NapE protein n=1 Tax=Kiloniella laminariae TaxID=454162 RepID=A0ABT4LM20_9PROT|nr:periplasmic nitrate reductase, NapE protein [Kiloniella laminariae]MCZ4282119.1 periplasmic nitrate reductase, NapE protein [Kiloniella laminariae]